MGFGQNKWLRAALLSAVVALGASGCVSTYGYRDGDGGDYYYADPSIDGYYDDYGPYGNFGYHYPGGWYGSIGYGYGSYRYGSPYRYGYPYGYPYGGNYGYGYGYGGYPYFYYPYAPRRHHPRPNPNTNPPPPGGVVDHTPPPGPGPGIDDRDADGGPWRNLDRVKRRIKTPQPSIASREPLPTDAMVEPQPGQMRRPMYSPQPGLEPRESGQVEYRRRVAQPQPQIRAPQPEYHEPRPAPTPRVESRRQEYEAPRAMPMGGGGRRGMQEREAGPDPAP